MLFWGGEEERCIHKLMMWIIWDSSGGITLMSKLTWLGCFSYDSLHIGPSDNALPWSFKKGFSLAWQGREDRRTYYISICSNLQTLPVWSVTRHTTEGTANIPQHNDVVGEQTFMWSPLVPVIGIGKQNLLQVFQAIFTHRWNTQIKRRENKYAESGSLHFSISALHFLFHCVDGITLNSVLTMARPSWDDWPWEDVQSEVLEPWFSDLCLCNLEKSLLGLV